MSEMPFSSLFGVIGSHLDGGSAARGAGQANKGGTSGKDSAAQDFASLIAGKMNSGSSLSGDRASAMVAQAREALSARGMAAGKAGQQVLAQAGNQSAVTSMLDSKLTSVIARIREQLSAYRQAVASGKADGQSELTALVQSMKKALDQIGGAAASTLAGQAGATGADGAGNFGSLVALIKSLSGSLVKLHQQLEQQAQSTDGNAAAASLAALLQQVQDGLHQWVAQGEQQVQQSGGSGQTAMNALLKQLDAILSPLDKSAQQTQNAQNAALNSKVGAGLQSAAQTVAASSENDKGVLLSRNHLGQGNAGADQPRWLTALLQQRQAAQANAKANAHTPTAGTNISASSQGVASALASTAASSSLASVQNNPVSQLLAQTSSVTQGADRTSAASLGSADTQSAGAGLGLALGSLLTPSTAGGIFGNGAAVPPANPQLASNVGQQVQWMVGKNLSSASIQVAPAELGPVKIQVQMQHNGELQVQLLAHQHVTRDVLEQSLPKLRDWLQEAGLGQAQVSVGADTSGSDSAAQWAGAQAGGSGSGGHASGQVGDVSMGAGDGTTSTDMVAVLHGPVTLLDLFA